MARLWFTFKGVDSREMGVYLVEPLEIPAAERQMRFEEVPGRAGALAIDQGGFLDVDATMEAYMRDGTQMSAVRAWMQGAGELILSTDATRFYRARVAGEVETPRSGRGLTSRGLTVPLRVSPFRYHVPAAGESGDDVPLTSSPATVTNPGTYASTPRLTIEGTGTAVLTIGTQIVEVDDLGGGIIIDSELGECFDLTETQLKNSVVTLMDDAFPTLAPGANIVSWTGDGVTKITVTPRWRDL